MSRKLKWEQPRKRPPVFRPEAVDMARLRWPLHDRARRLKPVRSTLLDTH